MIAGVVGFAVANPGLVPSVNLNIGAEELEEKNVEQLVHEGINDYRTNQSVHRLNYDDGLAEIADYHSAKMAEDGQIYHTSPEGETLGDRYRRFGYGCAGGENVAKTWYAERISDGAFYGSAEELAAGIVQQFVDSREHRENLLRSRWTRQGIGINVTEEDGNTAVYVTQNFC